jgi:hypothetical protein
MVQPDVSTVMVIAILALRAELYAAIGYNKCEVINSSIVTSIAPPGQEPAKAETNRHRAPHRQCFTALRTAAGTTCLKAASRQ